MKHLIKLAPIAFAILAASCDNSTQTAANEETTKSDTLIFDKGDKITNENFTGTTWLKNLVQADSINQIAVGSVTFEPGSRTRWHSHPAGQIILALDGIGYYQEKGNAKVIVKKGDVVKCPPDIPHWHGASADTKFVQVAITSREKGETVWLEPVIDDQYHK